MFFVSTQDLTDQGRERAAVEVKQYAETSFKTSALEQVALQIIEDLGGVDAISKEQHFQGAEPVFHKAVRRRLIDPFIEAVVFSVLKTKMIKH